LGAGAPGAAARSDCAALLPPGCGAAALRAAAKRARRSRACMRGTGGTVVPRVVEFFVTLMSG